MALFTGTQEKYYLRSQSFTGTGSQQDFVLTEAAFGAGARPTLESEIKVFVDGVEIDKGNYTYPKGSGGDAYTVAFTGNTNNTTQLESNGSPKNGLTVRVEQIAEVEEWGNYQFVKIKDIINNFLISYVGENKLIPKISRTDVAFHAQRGLAEMSYDTFRSEKSQEIEIPPALTMILPHDYVNYVKVSFIDANGIEFVLYPARKTSNPKALFQDSDYNYIFDSSTNKLLTAENSDTWIKYKAQSNFQESGTKRDTDELEVLHEGGRFGISPEHAQANGSFFIDNTRGKIYFSSNLNGKTVILKYISDSLGTSDEMQVHKLAEEALYKHIAHAILSTRSNIPEYIVRRLKKEKYAETRKAKLRLSNLKIEELTQVMRDKSTQIKH
tara:strand:+ start:754 stop:1905 length:1152 start_codon:yes stop_codon:yes gene_type:complete